MLQSLFHPSANANDDSNTALLQEFQSRVKSESYPKNHILHEAGKEGKHLYFIEKGLARIYYLQDGKDVSCHFVIENEIATAIDSFLKKQSSRYTIELLEDTTLYSITFKDLEYLLDNFPNFERLFRTLLMQAYDQLVDRLNDIQFHTAKERYDIFYKKHASLFQRINLGHIASYLGMTQETLSRMRKIKP